MISWPWLKCEYSLTSISLCKLETPSMALMQTWTRLLSTAGLWRTTERPRCPTSLKQTRTSMSFLKWTRTWSSPRPKMAVESQLWTKSLAIRPQTSTLMTPVPQVEMKSIWLIFPSSLRIIKPKYRRLRFLKESKCYGITPSLSLRKAT